MILAMLLRTRIAVRASRRAPKTVVFMHINDTFGTAMKVGIGAVMPKFNLPYTLVDTMA